MKVDGDQRASQEESQEPHRGLAERYQAVFESTATPMCIVDVQGRLVDANRELRHLVAYGPDGPLGTADFAEFLPAGLADVFRHALSRLVLSGATSLDIEAGIVDGKGQILDVILSLAPMPDSGEVVISIIDVTQEKTYARNLAEANERLADFLGVAAHELSMPATVIKGYVQTLLAHQRSLSEKQLSEILQGIAEYSERLSRLVTELLDVSRISAQRFDINPVPVGLPELWEEFQAETAAKRYKAEFAYFFEGGSEAVLLDGARLIQVLDILVDNAVKFSEDLRAQVDVRLEALPGELAAAVADRGRGVPEVLRHRIFERFFQVEDVEHHSITGLGLGLYIAKEIVEAQGGSIWHEPRPGGGSIFRVRIPLTA